MARQDACHEAQSRSHPAPMHAILSLKAVICDEGSEERGLRYGYRDVMCQLRISGDCADLSRLPQV